MRKCITCLRDKPIGDFSLPGGNVGRECASCYEALLAKFAASAPAARRVLVPDTDEAKRRRAREDAAPGRYTKAQRDARWAYYGGRCWMCARRAHVMDHVKPLARGGSNWPSNLRPACWKCNGRKAARWPFKSR